MKMSIAAIALLGAAGTAFGQLRITETYTGVSGEDGTEDWFEVVNISNATVDTGNFWYDDVSAAIADGGQLDSIMLAPGEKAIFLVADAVDAAQALTDFAAVWGNIPNVGVTNGGGGLGQGADTVNILAAGDIVIDALSYNGIAGDLFTIERVNGLTRKSVLGENGAYESDPFFNDNIGVGPDFLITLVGSPGLIPTPGTVALLGVAGLAGIRRRR